MMKTAEHARAGVRHHGVVPLPPRSGNYTAGRIRGDPNPTHYRKNVFDMGEYGIGVLANSLELGCDCRTTSTSSAYGWT